MLTLFGFAAIGFTLVCYLLDDRSRWWTLGFAGGSLLSSGYAALQGAWPFATIELLWAAAAVRRWLRCREPLA